MNRIVIFFVSGLAIMLMLGHLAGQVGGITIRRTSTQANDIRISFTDPVLPGTGTTIHLSVPDGTPNSRVEARMRTLEGEEVIGEGRIDDGNIRAQIPCGAGAGEVSIILADAGIGKLLAVQQATLMPDGPDCMR